MHVLQLLITGNGKLPAREPWPRVARAAQFHLSMMMPARSPQRLH
jgi:hypothetical protein